MGNKDLIVPIKLEPALLFTEKGTETIIKEVEKKVKGFKGSVETDKERKEIASFAFKIAKTKTFLETLGKDLVSGEKAKLKIIDGERKRLRDNLDDLKVKVRQPLTEYEEAEKARIEAEKQQLLFELDYEEALGIDDLFNRERELEKKEAEIAKAEEEKRQKEETERLEKERIEREERIKKEAAEKAKRDAKEALERSEREKIELAKQAERDKKQAIQKAKDDARREQEEKDRQKALIKAEEERKAANKNHQKRINREALEDLVTLIPEDKAKEIIVAIVNTQIRHISINY